MACKPSTDNASSIALLRRLRAGEHVHYVHRVDVCDAPPEALVADLEPVPGTGLDDDDGYSRIWYLYHAKKYMNSRGDTSGHRQRAVTGGGGTKWHSEISPKDVQGSGGGTFCKLSYGRKMGRSIERMGWCMAEYDFAADANKKQDEAAADASNYVLCKVYRSPRAKGKSASASASSSSNKLQTAKKRKAGGGDHPEAPPAKSIQQEEAQVQQEDTTTAFFYQAQGGVESSEHGGDFNFNVEDINFYLDESMMRDKPEQGGLQQTIAELAKFIQQQEPQDTPAYYYYPMPFHQPEKVQEVAVQQTPPPGHGGEFIQMPFGPMVPVVAEATVEDMLGIGPADPETVYGQWNGGMARASVPWSSYAPTTGWNSNLQGSDPLQLPYLTC